MRHGSLFSGIGGFDIAATWMDWDNIFTCEKDSFCRRILKHYWPQTESHEDIYQFEATKYRGYVDVISGGFPCQPFSNAGRRKGKNDDRYLWPEAHRIIRQVQPEWLVLENVAGLFTILEPESLSQVEIKEIELFCSDSEQKANATIIRLQRRIIGSIISEIGSAGYVLPQLEDGTPIVLCIPACAVNAPHRRDRVWFVAHSQHSTDRPDIYRSTNVGGSGENHDRRDLKTTFDKGCPGNHSGRTWADTNSYSDGRFFGNGQYEIVTGEGWQYAQYDAQQADNNAANTRGKRLERSFQQGEQLFTGSREIPDWNGWPAQSPVCSRDDGVSSQLDGITFSKWRTASVKAYGNAIVPQIALELFRAINSIKQG